MKLGDKVRRLGKEEEEREQGCFISSRQMFEFQGVGVGTMEA
jgi:hypothetical protein